MPGGEAFDTEIQCQRVTRNADLLGLQVSVRPCKQAGSFLWGAHRIQVMCVCVLATLLPSHLKLPFLRTARLFDSRRLTSVQREKESVNSLTALVHSRRDVRWYSKSCCQVSTGVRFVWQVPHKFGPLFVTPRCHYVDGQLWFPTSLEPRLAETRASEVDQNHRTGLTWPCAQGVLYVWPSEGSSCSSTVVWRLGLRPLGHCARALGPQIWGSDLPNMEPSCMVPQLPSGRNKTLGLHVCGYSEHVCRYTSKKSAGVFVGSSYVLLKLPRFKDEEEYDEGFVLRF